MKRIAHVAGTVFGIGHLRPAPGTWGSLAALPLAWGLHLAGGFAVLVMGTAAVMVVLAALTSGRLTDQTNEVTA